MQKMKTIKKYGGIKLFKKQMHHQSAQKAVLQIRILTDPVLFGQILIRKSGTGSGMGPDPDMVFSTIAIIFNIKM
jgi:hypothetical protein